MDNYRISGTIKHIVIRWVYVLGRDIVMKNFLLLILWFGGAALGGQKEIGLSVSTRVLLRNTAGLHFPGSRGNEERYLKFEPFLPNTEFVCSPEGTDVIQERVSVAMHKRVADATNIVTKTLAVMDKEWILQCAMWHSTLAQCGDGVKAYDIIKARGLLDKAKILTGDSKGSALALNLLGSGILSDVKGALLFSPFYHTNAGFHDFAGLPHTPVMEEYVAPIARGFVIPCVDEYGPQPVDSVAGIAQHAKDVPILLGVIMNDKKVPAYQQIALYIKLKRAGCNVRMFTVEDGEHGEMQKCADKERVEKITQSFWGHVKGEVSASDLAECMKSEYAPSVESVEDAVKLLKDKFNLTVEEVDACVERGSQVTKDFSKASCVAAGCTVGTAAVIGAAGGAIVSQVPRIQFPAGIGVSGGVIVGALLRLGAHEYYNHKISRDTAAWKLRLENEERRRSGSYISPADYEKLHAGRADNQQ